MLKQNGIVERTHNTLIFPCEKSKMVPSATLTMKNIFVFPSRSRFAAKLICCIAFGSASRLVVYLNLLLSFYSNY